MRHYLVELWRVACQEWRSIWRDEGVALITVFALFIYGISYSLGYGGEVLTEVPIAVVDEDHRFPAKKFAEQCEQFKGFEVLIATHKDLVG